MMRYAGLVAVVLGVLAAGPGRADPDAETTALLNRLAVERRDAAARTYNVLWTDYRERRASEDALYRWSLRWLEAERQLSAQPADQTAAFRAHYERMRDLERLIRRLQTSRQSTVDETSSAEFYRAEAEIWWVQAREGEKKGR